jgi:hypothetical protein
MKIISDDIFKPKTARRMTNNIRRANLINYLKSHEGATFYEIKRAIKIPEDVLCELLAETILERKTVIAEITSPTRYYTAVGFYT